MRYDKAIFGIYPRSESLRVSIGRYERGKLNGNIRDIMVDEKRKFYRFAEKNNVSVAGDPLFNWHDIYRPLFSIFSGLEQGELHRYKETNTFYRKPIFAGDVKLSSDPLKPCEDEFSTPVYLPDAHGLRYLFLPSPLSILRDAENVKEKSRKQLLEAFRDLIVLIKHDFTIFYEHYDIDGKLLEDISSITDPTKAIVVSPQSNLAANGDLRKYKFNGIVSGNPEDLQKNLEASGRGFIPFWNCRRTSIESAGSVEKLLDQVKGSIMDSQKYTICNTDFFDFLPREIADRKVAFDGVA